MWTPSRGMGLVLGFGCFVFKKPFVKRRERRRNAEVLGRFFFSLNLEALAADKNGTFRLAF